MKRKGGERREFKGRALMKESKPEIFKREKKKRQNKSVIIDVTLPR